MTESGRKTAPEVDELRDVADALERESVSLNEGYLSVLADRVRLVAEALATTTEGREATPDEALYERLIEGEERDLLLCDCGQNCNGHRIGGDDV